VTTFLHIFDIPCSPHSPIESIFPDNTIAA